MNGRPTWVRWRVLVWLTLAAALAYLCRSAVGAAESTIREDLGLTLRQSGWFMGAFFWTYAVFQVPGGWLAHRWGTRIALTIFAFAWGIGSILLGLAPALWLLLLAQLLMGMAQAGAFPASCNSISHWMPLSRRSLSCGILATGMQVGAIVAGALTGLLLAGGVISFPIGNPAVSIPVAAVSWRWIFIAFAVPSLIWAVCFLVRFRNDPARDPAVNHVEFGLITSGREEIPTSEAEGREPTPWLAVFSSGALWLLCGQQICRAAGYMFFASWFPTFLQETRGVSVKDAGYLQGLVFGATLAGSLLGGLFVDAIWRRTGNLRLSRGGVGAAFLFLCGALILGAFFVHSLSLAVGLLTAGALCAAMAGPCAFSSTIDIGGRHIPQVFGVMNMSGNFAAAATPVIVGHLFEWTANWNLVLVLFAVIFFAGSLCWAFVDPSKKISSRER